MNEDRNRDNRNPDEVSHNHSSSDNNQSQNGPTPVYLNSESTLQTPAEHRKDQNTDATKDNTISVSADDLHETKADRMAGSDRAGTAERKDNTIDE